MSSSSSSAEAQAAALSNIHFTGGYPTSADLAPSIIFLVAYVILAPVLIFRLVRRSDRTAILIRPSIFISVRIAMLIIRAIMSKTSYGEGLLIAELVLVSIGFLFLIEPVVSMWNRHVDSAVPKDQRPVWVKRLATILKIVVIGAIVTAIIGSSLISQALDNPSELGTVRGLRKASAILSVVAAVVVLLATIRTHFTFPVSLQGTIYIIGLSCCLIIISVYRAVQTFSSGTGGAVQSRALFWVLQMFFELVAFVMLLAISIPTWFPGDQTKTPIANDAEMGQTNGNVNAPYKPSGQFVPSGREGDQYAPNEQYR